MKFSIALSLIILAVAAAFGWRDHQRLVVVRETHTRLVTEAAELGISLDPGHPTGRVLVTKRSEREDKEAVARDAAADFIAFAREMEELEKSGEGPARSQEAMKRVMDFFDRMMKLDAAQLKIVIAEFRDAPGLKDQTRQGLITFSIMTIANDHPQAALAIFTESSDLLEDNQMIGRHVVAGALANWAKDDPMGALRWVRDNGEKFPELVNDDAKGGLIAGAAAQDPKLAFQLLDELYDNFRSDAFRDIASAARTEEERNATLAAMRDYVSTLSDKGQRTGAIYQGLRTLAFGNGYQDAGFESSTRWIESAELTPEELEGATSNLEHAVNLDEAGKWIEWLGDSELPAGKADKRIFELAAQWTEKDYQAAGKWLAGAADSPEKQTAVRAYAEKVFPYEPEIAVQWALTVPPGKDRDQTFRKLYQSMPKESDEEKAAADAFAEEHGIKK